jgi:hypothetical protein
MVHFFFRHRMIAAHHQHQPIDAIGFALRAGRQRGGRDGESEIELARLHAVDHVDAIVLDPDIDAGRFFRQPRHQRRRQQDGMSVEAHHAHRPLDERRIEDRRLEYRLHLIQRARQLPRQRLGPWRERIPAARRAYQQHIAQHVPQSRQRPAHGRLAQANVGSGCAHILPPSAAPPAPAAG